MLTKPKLRNDIDFGMKHLILKAADGIDGLGLQQACISCRNFDEPTELCRLAGARPPARVIALSCERYDDIDEIPF